jgi:hypothetical protein
MTLMKALIPSTILTLLVAAIVGSAGSSGSFLSLEDASISGFAFYWSWPFFLTVMALNSLLVVRMQRDERAG